MQTLIGQPWRSTEHCAKKKVGMLKPKWPKTGLMSLKSNSIRARCRRCFLTTNSNASSARRHIQSSTKNLMSTGTTSYKTLKMRIFKKYKLWKTSIPLNQNKIAKFQNRNCQALLKTLLSYLTFVRYKRIQQGRKIMRMPIKYNNAPKHLRIKNALNSRSSAIRRYSPLKRT